MRQLRICPLNEYLKYLLLYYKFIFMVFYFCLKYIFHFFDIYTELCVDKMSKVGFKI